MVAEIANTLIDHLRATPGSVDAYGDPYDNQQVLVADVPAFIAEVSQQVQDPATSTPRTIRTATGRVPYWLGVQADDQIRDKRTGSLYAVQDVVRPSTLTGAPVDIQVSLKRVSAEHT